MRQLNIFSQVDGTDPSDAYDDLVNVESNADALSILRGWPSLWMSNALLILGPAGSGKTHLAHIWQKRSDALDATHMLPDWPSAFDGHHTALLIDMVGAVKINGLSATLEVNVFHIINAAKERGIWLLIIARLDFPDSIKLRDLRSRIIALPTAYLHHQRLGYEQTCAMLCKHMTDYQLMLTRSQYDFIARRITRNAHTIRKFCALANDHVVKNQCKLTRPELQRILQRIYIVNNAQDL